MPFSKAPRLALALAAHALIVLAMSAVPKPANADSVHLAANINTTIVAQDSSPFVIGALGTRLLFSATTAQGPRIWITDGTAAGTVQLVQGLRGWGPVSAEASGSTFLVVGQTAYFVASSDFTGLQLWATDGTPQGTRHVFDYPTSISGDTMRLQGVLNGRIVFTATDGGNSRHLFSTDGTTAGTQDLAPPSGGYVSVGEAIYVGASRIWFSALSTTTNYGVWISDGTPQGTHEAVNSFGVNSSTGFNAVNNVRSFQPIAGGVLYASSRRLWKVDVSDTIVDVTVAMGFAGSGPPRLINDQIVSVGGRNLFLAEGPSGLNIDLWQSDGTTPGTFKVTDDYVRDATSGERVVSRLYPVGSRVLYFGDDGVNGTELWSNDGTPGGSVRLTTSAVAVSPSDWQFGFSVLGTIGGRLYFLIDQTGTSETFALWESDGTLAGTRRVAGIPDIPGSQRWLTQVAGDASRVFVFASHDAANVAPTNLYAYDAVAHTSTLLQQGHSSAELAFAAGGQFLLFSTRDPVLGIEPWTSDGTVAGTHLLTDLYPQTTDAGSAPEDLVEFGGQLVFTATDATGGRELWTSDGTAAGTRRLADLNPGAASSSPNHLRVLNGALYFFATDAGGTSRLMKLASLTDTPQVLAAVGPTPLFMPSNLPACSIDGAVALGGSIFFPGYVSGQGTTLWRSDGTAAGTAKAIDVGGTGAANPCSLTVFNGRIYFTASTSATGMEIWSTDGTQAGTSLLIDIRPGTPGSNPISLNAVGGALYFTVDDGVHGYEPWVSDGTAAGTRLLLDIAPGATSSFAGAAGVLGNKVMIGRTVTVNGSPQFEIWTTDGTTAGTSKAIDVLGSLASNSFLLLNGKLFFTAGSTGDAEPWITDGTPAGTRLLKDLNASGSSMPRQYDNFRGVAVFLAANSAGVLQMWRSDGTASGTVLVSDSPAIYPVPSTGYRSRRFLAAGQRYYFAAESPAQGPELFVLANDAPSAVADAATSSDGQAATITVLANDIDADGALDATTVQIVTAPAHGTASVSPAGVVTYTPSSGYSGTDSFTYRVTDLQGATSAPATVTLTVTLPTVTVTPGGGTNSSGGSSGGGGGSMDLLLLMLLSSAVVGEKFRQFRRRQLT